MSTKIVRFLNSIGIQNTDGFDMDFKVAKLDPNDPSVFLMTIKKETGWDFYAFEQFRSGLETIEYPFVLDFEYGEISEDSIASFVNDWLVSERRIFHNLDISIVGNKLVISYTNERQRSQAEDIADDLFDLFQYINYPYEVEAKEIIDEEEKKRKEEMRLAEKVALQGKRNVKFNTKGNYMKLNCIEEVESLSPQNIDLVGDLFNVEAKTAQGGKIRVSFGIGDGKGAIKCTAMENDAALPRTKLLELKDDLHVNVRGKMDFDRYSGERSLFLDYVDILPPKELRTDPEEEKRVELHLHSKMSVMDGLGEVENYCKVAKSMGMKAIALTDHGNIQAFPELQKFAAKNGLKPIYGCEFYMFEPRQKYVFNPCDRLLNTARYCIFDLETTGLSAVFDRITEFGGVIMENGIIVDRLDILINPEMPIPAKIQAKTHITDEMVKDCPTIEQVMDRIEKFIGDNILVTHNASFDFSFINEARRRMGKEIFKNPVIDTLALSHYLFPERRYHNLGALSSALCLDTYNDEEAHRADFDAEALSEAWSVILMRLDESQTMKHEDLMNLRFTEDNFPNLIGNELQMKIKMTVSSFFKNIRPHHAIVLVKDEQGLKDLYELVSLSNTEYLADVPKIPKHVIAKYRQHLLIGSACWNGEVFDTAMYSGYEKLKEVISYYDYVEIQPIENYSYLLNVGDLTEERLHQMLRLIIKAADEVGVRIVATGDCHYVNPEDKIARDVFIDTKAIGGGRHPLNPSFREKLPPFPNPDQHFRSTREMLDSFKAWVSEDRAKEFVIGNSNWVADQIETVYPIKEGTFAPNANLPGSDELLRKLCYSNLEKYYGPNPDPKVKERLDKELNGIINGGYSVIYYIAHKIINKADADGYFVGSRGSVGSSFVATMADITEVNPLEPHYLCPKCKHFEWSTDPKIRSGFDLEDKYCPECGTLMKANGQNIPFETFLGFNADKTPDIDLNFPPDYQSIAHDYTRQLLGPENCFRAGTIQTVADKNAFGYVRGYFERQGIDPSSIPSAKIAMIANMCKGVKRTTGQHPGGIVVIPKDMSVFDFTPYQYPAEDIGSDWLTTHFDFNSMHDEVLKLDLLGQLEPMILRKLALSSGVPFKSIPMNDKKVISLFYSPKNLGLKTNPLKFQTGAIGIPEFGTSFVQGLLSEAKPRTFNDLLAISGLSHGTDVWAFNAQDLIKQGKADITSVIGCRDDIMRYLIEIGCDKLESFKFMEIVRKNKGHANRTKIEEKVGMLREHGVPEWYIESCRRIQYLFPRAHATAYVINAVRNAWYKLYKPLHFYGVYLSDHVEKFDLKAMIEGLSAVVERIDSLEARSKDRSNPLSAKEEEILKGLRVCAEFLDRGFKFHDIDLYKSEAHDFVIDEENNALYPPFAVIDGLGQSAAESVVKARKDGEFTSKEDLRKRTSLSETNIVDLSDAGALDGMGESDQLSLFDFFN